MSESRPCVALLAVGFGLGVALGVQTLLTGLVMFEGLAPSSAGDLIAISFYGACAAGALAGVARLGVRTHEGRRLALRMGWILCGGFFAFAGPATQYQLVRTVACQRGDGRACEQAGAQFERGAVMRDARIARAFYRRGCDAWWPYACGKLLQLSPDATACARLGAICSAPAEHPLGHDDACVIFNRECGAP
ncbi:MAG TPA: hypothetical protein VFF06_01605 [Polyangia bacterium]|nr:hypothetical protein [Polyangia bacterium]